MLIIFVLLGVLLGAFLSFPGFALAAIACSISYAIYNSDGTIIGYIANLLGVVIALQLGFFSSVMAMILRRRFQLSRRNDQ
jgi:uncharacterized membrane protein